MRHCLILSPWLLGLAIAGAAQATDVSLVGLYSGKAMVVIDGGRPRLIAVGVKTPEGVKLLALEEGAAQIEIDGRKQRLSGRPEFRFRRQRYA